MVERSRAYRVDRDSSPNPDQTLTSTIGPGVRLTDSERRAVLALDSLKGVPLSVKRTLFTADIYMRDGVFRAVDVLNPDREPDASYDSGEIEKIVDARDAVVIDPRFEAPWIQFGLLKEPNFVEVALSRKMGEDVGQIAGKLEIEEKEVEEILRTLDDFGIFRDVDYRKVKQLHQLRKLEMIDRERKEFGLRPLSNPELGRRFGRSADTIDDWRNKNRLSGKASTEGRSVSLVRGEEIRAIMIKNPGLTNPQTVDLLASMGFTGTTINTVKYHRNILIGNSQVDRKRSLPTKGETAKNIADRAAKIKEALRIALEKCNQERRPLILKKLREENEDLAGVPYTTLMRYYHQMGESQVPQLKLGRPSKR